MTVFVETIALVSRRLGWMAVERLLEGILPVVRVVMVDETTHATALRAYRAAGSDAVSLVDRTSFAVMRADGIDRAFAYDQDFDLEGFQAA